MRGEVRGELACLLPPFDEPGETFRDGFMEFAVPVFFTTPTPFATPILFAVPALFAVPPGSVAGLRGGAAAWRSGAFSSNDRQDASRNLNNAAVADPSSSIAASSAVTDSAVIRSTAALTRPSREEKWA